MDIGQVRPARKGEVPHFYAYEAIEENQGVVDMQLRAIEENLKHQQVAPIIIDCDDPLALVMRFDAPRRRAMLRKMRKGGSATKFFTFVIIFLMLGAAWYSIAHAETVKYDPPAEIQSPVQVRAIITAYTSSKDETDATPFITASGTHTSSGALACPAKYPFGTQVKIGDATYTCRDRMNERYTHAENFDVWVHTKAEAAVWGRQMLDVQILGVK